MDADVHIKRRRTSDCDAQIEPFLSSDSSPDDWIIFPWNKFSGFTISERAGRQTSWIWQHGFDIQSCDSPLTRKWVCRPCLKKPKPKTSGFSAVGTQNIEKHLFKEHRLVDESGRRPPATEKGWKDKTPSRNIAAMLSLNAHDPKEQAIANALIRRFDRDHFQKLLLEWVVDANISFRQPEHGRLRRIFEYLNPSVAVTNAHISHSTVRKRIVDLHRRHKAQIIDHLRNIPGKIHIAFDGWRSRNRHALYGIVCFYVDHDGAPCKLVLGLPELKMSHSGENIAAQVLEILEGYEILDKLGYITLDNATNMDSAAEEIAKARGLNSPKRRIRCFGHVLNLVVKALLFGHKTELSRLTLMGNQGLTLLSMKPGLTYRLRALQEDFFRRSSSTENRARKPLDVVLDNHTRWLSTLYMIRRGLKLRPFLDELVEKATLEFSRNGLMDSVLVDFEEALRMLEGDSQKRARRGGHIEAYGNMWDVASTYEFLMERLEEWKATAENYPDPEHFKVNINLGWDKLNEYYTKLDETPVYYAAAILNPVSRWGYFENTWTDTAQRPWLAEAKRMVRRLWEEEFKSLPTREVGDEDPPFKRLKAMSALERHRALRTSTLPCGTCPGKTPLDAELDEYDQWLLSPDLKHDPLVSDPVQYWWERREDYPRLSQMALD
ncbi:hypothetical protein ARSEF1564_010086, partial [Beauveria bassiana]